MTGGPTTRVGVVGAGVMGAGIAQALAVAGCEVICQDLSSAAVTVGADRVRTGRFGLDRAVERGRVTAEDAAAALDRLRFTTDAELVTQVDLVVEAVPEHLDLKIALLRDLDAACPEHTVLASNTSGFSISALAAATDRPDRVVGWHWASPAPVMKMAEVIRAPSTSDATTEFVVALAVRAGKRPVVVRDCTTSWGHVANRVYAAMLREAERVLAEDVATPEQVDQIMVDCFGWPTGPFETMRAARTGWRDQPGMASGGPR